MAYARVVGRSRVGDRARLADSWLITMRYVTASKLPVVECDFERHAVDETTFWDPGPVLVRQVGTAHRRVESRRPAACSQIAPDGLNVCAAG
jgi:hypothetical protein